MVGGTEPEVLVEYETSAKFNNIIGLLTAHANIFSGCYTN